MVTREGNQIPGKTPRPSAAGPHEAPRFPRNLLPNPALGAHTCPGSRCTPPSAPPPGLALRPPRRDLAAPPPTGHPGSAEASRMQMLSRGRLGPARRGGSGPNRRWEAGVRSARTRTDPAVPLDLRCGAERRPALQCALAHLLPRRRATQCPRSLWQPLLASDLCYSAWGAGWECSAVHRARSLHIL